MSARKRELDESTLPDENLEATEIIVSIFCPSPKQLPFSFKIKRSPSDDTNFSYRYLPHSCRRRKTRPLSLGMALLENQVLQRSGGPSIQQTITRRANIIRVLYWTKGKQPNTSYGYRITTSWVCPSDIVHICFQLSIS